MLIVCPNCATSYMVDPAATGPAGRIVRCVRCKTSWFAGGPKPKPAVADFVDDVIAEAEARENSPASSPPLPPTPSIAADDDDFGDESHQPLRQAEGRPEAEPPPSVPEEAEAAYAESPPLVPPLEHVPLPEPQEPTDFTAETGENFVARRTRMQQRLKQKRRSSKWTALILVLFGFNVAVVGARHEVVRYLPQTASLFAAIGLPVNLRGLTFADVKVSRDEADGVAVLVVEGNIISSGKPVEVPRMRFAVRNGTGQEIYAWTAPPSRSILGPNETLPFRSRLASPPADASDVLVRFSSANDGAPAK